MKKISFGSFPFINIDKKTRMCLDKYLIKSFADQIVLTDIFKNINTAKDFVYLTPEAIIDSLYNFNAHRPNRRPMYPRRGFYMENSALDYLEYDKEFLIKEDKELLIFESNYEVVPIIESYLAPLNTKRISLEEADSKEADSKEADSKGGDSKDKKDNKTSPKLKYYDPYMAIIKRAFFIMRKFFEKLSRDAFYRDYVVLPVYSEKLIDLNPKELRKSQYEYSFFILTNDLLSDLKIDEVEFNDAEIVNALYIFHQLFPHKSLTDFDEKDLELVIKLYSFFERNNIDPIEFFKVIYTIIFMFAQSATLKEFDQKAQKIISDSKLKGIFDKETITAIRNAIIDYLKKNPKTPIVSNLKKYTKKDFYKLIFNAQSKTFKAKDFIELIFRNSDLQEVITKTFENLNNAYSIKREQIRFRNIIILFKDLAKFNSKKLNDIITDASFDLQFKIKYQDKGIIYNELIIKQQLDRSFQSFLKDIDDYVQKLRNSIYQKYANKSTNTNEFANELRDIEQQIQSIDKELARLRREMNNAIPGTADYLDYLKKYNEFANQKALLISQLNAAQVTDVINNKTIKNRVQNYESNLEKLSRLKQQIEDLISRGITETDPELQALINEYNKLQLALNKASIAFDDNIPENKFSEVDAYYSNKSINKIPFELAETKVELGELYRTLYRGFTNEAILSSILENLCKEGMFDENTFLQIKDNFLNHRYSEYSSEQILAEFIYDIYLDIKSIVDILAHKIKSNIEAKLQSSIIGTSARDSSITERVFQKLKILLKRIDNEWDKISETMTKTFIRFLMNRVFKIICRHIQRDIKQGEIEFKETVKGIHPLLAKLAKDPDHFKSFIFGFDMLINLYNLFYLTEMEKFYAGWAIFERPLIDMPMKYNNAKNKIDFVLEDSFKLKNNPIWIIGKRDIYLSLPDYMSLIKSRIFSKIPKEKIKNYCKLDYNKIMTEKNMAKLLQDKDLDKIIHEYRKKLEKLKKLDKEINSKEQQYKNKKKKEDKDKLKKEINNLKDEKALLINEIKILKAQMNALSNGKAEDRDAMALASVHIEEF